MENTTSAINSVASSRQLLVHLHMHVPFLIRMRSHEQPFADNDRNQPRGTDVENQRVRGRIDPEQCAKNHQVKHDRDDHDRRIRNDFGPKAAQKFPSESLCP